MLTKLLVLSILLAGSVFGQSDTPELTAQLLNGRFWKGIPKGVKPTYMIAMVDVAQSLKIHPFVLTGEPNEPCLTLLNKMADSIIVAPLTTEETEAELDKFYSEPSNAPVPIVFALSWVNAKARGSTRENLDGLESTLRELAVRIEELAEQKKSEHKK